MRIDRWCYVIPLRFRSLFRGQDVDAELDEELRYHLERQIELLSGCVPAWRASRLDPTAPAL
jgi:hypothetical protein